MHGRVYLTLHKQFPDLNGSISCTPQTWSRIAIQTLTKKLPLNTVNPNFTKRNTKTYTQRYLIFRTDRCIRTSGKVIYFSQLWCSFYRTCCAQEKRLKCLALDFALKQLNCILSHELNPLKIRFTFPQRTVYLTVHKQLRYLTGSISCTGFCSKTTQLHSPTN